MLQAKDEQIKKFILLNRIFITVQIILVIVCVILNLVSDDSTVFITIFVHTGLFVLYNAISESIIEDLYLRKKYAKICDETHRLRYLQLKKRIYKTAKNKNDNTSSALILQSFIKSFILIIHIISMLFMINFE